MEDMQVHLTAHKAAVEGIKSEAEEKRLADLDSQSKKHQENIGINLITNSMKCVFFFIGPHIDDKCICHINFISVS